MGRRGNGEGYVFQLATGNWAGQLMDGYKEDGKKNIVCFYASTRGEVLQKMRRYKQAQEDGTEYMETDMSFSDWADAWYEDYKTQVQPSTYSNYRFTLKTLKEYFKNTPICMVKQMDINIFLNSLKKQGLSFSKISKCKAMLVQIFRAAQDNDMITKNPAELAKPIRMLDTLDSESEHKKDAFSAEEIEILGNELPNNLVGNSIMLMLGSGLRTQELLALRPDDIAEDGSEVHVNKAIKIVDGKPTLGPPKSKKSYRSIPIPKNYREYAMFLRHYGGAEMVWAANSENGLYNVGTFRRRYYRALADIPNVRTLSPHCCRHTYVTRLQAKGVPLELIARIVGHSDIKVTDNYAHADQKMLAGIVEVLNEKKEA